MGASVGVAEGTGVGATVGSSEGDAVGVKVGAVEGVTSSFRDVRRRPRAL